MNGERLRKNWSMVRGMGVLGMAFAMASTSAGARLQQKGGMDTATTDAHGKFYCNVKALSTKERARLKELSEKLAAARTNTIETAKGYEFQYSPEKISIPEVGEWVVLESRCCAFLDFHIDLENQGKLVCLRLTGSEGVKAFIRSDFHI
ncbi:MAG TPA: hypothetical protein VKH15_03530 [Candidatus Acidoferrum sp.]|nr:hypothetical protein [Candidatus Acidoferrum sp.]